MGQVARSHEVVSAFAMFVFLAAITWWFTHIVPGVVSYMQSSFSFQGWQALEEGAALDALRGLMIEVLEVALPVAALAAVAGLLANVAQVGLVNHWALVGLRWDRMNPLAYFKRLASLELPVGLLKSIAKGLIVIAIAAYGLRDEPAELWRLAFGSIGALGDHMRQIALTVATRVAIAMAVVALADYLWIRYRHEEQLKMSRQELKDEFKEAEGNPQIKAHMRRRARERLKELLVDSVKSATVVAMNPTHYAVALRYQREKDPTPRVVAKGRGYKALRIRDIALANDIPVVQDKPLARVLYAAVKVGQTIPLDLYRSVARLLAIVYRQKNTTRRANPITAPATTMTHSTERPHR
jgi:flagellar biosynthesis protein FlhB